ncbi:MAG: phosphatidylserine/phosphatidylglycerophosphate/cardiolipin synthase-like enzyme [Saprospiraceae bacterium]|jgi:phosphatidylserine/phosphatidylglycerophosphate/cardiolipin synthase-like enzyme
MNKLIAVLSFIIFSFSAFAQIDIAVARNMSEGSTVTVEGIVTNGAELSIIRYIQDATGAIAAYPGAGSVANFPDNVSRGDLVQVTGELKTFNGLLEIDPITAYTVISSGNPLPDPLLTTPNGVNEANEAKLLQINGATFQDGGNTFAAGNYTFSANGEQSEIFVRSDSPLLGSTIPLATVNLTGISSEFNTMHQLLLRDINDIEIADNFYFTSTPIQSDITNDGFKLDWTTNVAGSTTIEYGTTTALGETVTVGGMTTNHSLALTDLDPAVCYYIKPVSNNGNTTIQATSKVYSTASNSTGAMRVYFNHGVDGDFSNGSSPTNVTSAAVEAAIINKINNAQSTIDFSFYNINRTTIVAALTNAYNNGIQVRYIADDQTANLALQDPTPPFPIVKGNAGDPLMHNKFMIIDADSENESWVSSGSTNLTDNNLADDYNNFILIQDQALAKAYTLEFEEMWGSSDPTPGIFTITFGEDKADNTPHLFNINGVKVESYFSPSDNTTSKIIDAIESADSDLEFAILSFTKNELGTAVRDAHVEGVSVRGIINSINDQGSEYDFLVGQGVNVIPDNQPGQMHHKYAIIDATNPSSDPIVITGSHNWSASAEDRNDENTLIIHDADVANIFLQEFEARWCEATSGTSCITVTTEVSIEGFEVTLSPNPATDVVFANMEISKSSDLTISLMDMNGRVLQSFFLKNVQGTVNEEIIVSGMPTGVYVVMFKVGEEFTARQLQVVR